MKRVIALLLFSGLLVCPAAAQSTIFFVRHAEKAQGEDPDLTEAGRARAESLASLLKDTGISAIYTSEVKRTQQTAAPLAKLLHLEPIAIPAKDRDALVTKLKATSGNVLSSATATPFPS